MTQPTQRQVDKELQQSMDLFSRAQVGAAGTINAQRPTRILTAFDASSQDVAAALLTRQLAERLQCASGYAVVGNDPQAVIHADAQHAMKSLGAEEVTASGEENYERVLAAATEYQADLLIVPCPFGRDFDSLGEDSTGTVIDVLTARWRAPLIAIRRPDAIGRDPTDHLRIILTGENAAAEEAARWATGLAAPRARLEMLLLVEESFYQNFREALHSIQPEVDVSYEDLESALARTYGRLHAALQHTAAAESLDYELLIRHEGDQQPITPEDPQTHPALMILGIDRSSHDSQGEAQEFIRRSPHPVLVVPVD